MNQDHMEDDIDQALANLVAAGLVAESLNVKGEKQYQITDLGIAQIESLLANKN